MDHNLGHHESGFRRGIELFNTRRFFDAHEAWEEIWLSSPEPRKTFLQGIIQIAAAYHHYLRGNRAGACSLLGAGLRRITPFSNPYHGVDIESLRVAAREWREQLTAGGDPGADRLPHLQSVTTNFKIQISE